MHRKLLTRAALVAVLGWGLSSGTARAQAPVPFPKVPPQATELPPGVPPVDSSPVKRPFRAHKETGRPVGCWGSFNGFGCSSLHSELGFIFGGCRMFFGEPCLKGAPPSSLPPGAGPMSGYGPNSSWAYRQGGYGITPNGTAPNGANNNPGRLEPMQGGAGSPEEAPAKSKWRLFGGLRKACGGCSESSGAKR